MARLPTGLLYSGAAILSTVWLGAQTPPPQPTFYKDVLPILQRHCQMCHGTEPSNTGGHAAPMALTTYEQARPYARAIVRKVQAREMPPWLASGATKGVFANE